MDAKILLMTISLLASGQSFSQTTTTTQPTKNKKKKDSKTSTKSSAPTEVVAPVAVKPAEESKPVDLAALIAPLTLGELKTFQYMKDHFSASYHGEFYFQRRDSLSVDPEEKKLQDFRMLHSPTVTYKPNKNWQFLATAEFKYSDVSPDPAFPNNYYRGLFTITRKGILNEKDHGIGFDFGIGRRDFNTGVAPTQKGNYRAFSTLTKTFGKHNASIFVQYLKNDPKVWSQSTWEHGLEFVPTLNLQLTEKLSYLFNDDINLNWAKSDTNPNKTTLSHEMNLAYFNYQWNDKVNTYYQFKYYHLEAFSGVPPKDDYFEHYAGIGYSFGPKATLTLEAGSEVFHAHDGKGLFSEKVAYPELALYVDLAL